jgi:peroxiredoxin Q/BCP
MSLKIGDSAPDFSLNDHQGRSVSLKSLLGESPLVIFFYPKAFTPGCTGEVCAFRDAYERFTEAGATVVGISSDDQATQAKFAARYKLPYLLLADENSQVRKAWGVPKTLGILYGRVTYVLDPRGTVRAMFSSQMDLDGHIETALEAVRQIQTEFAPA